MNFKTRIKQSITSVDTHLFERLSFALIVLASIFLAFYKINEIPAGLQYDQLRSVLMPEFALKGLTDTANLRQITSYFILYGYLSHFLADVFRTSFSAGGLILASRLPSALLFIQSTIVLWLLLKELKLSVQLRLFFFSIFLPSTTYVVFSHYIPLVAGYLFFTSASILLFLKSLRADLPHNYIFLYASVILAILSTYTHAISTIFVVIFYGVLFILLLSTKRQLMKRFFHRLFVSKGLAAIAIIIILVSSLFTLYPFLQGYFQTDEALMNRQEHTILFLIKEKRYDQALQSAGNRIVAYLHPNTLVTGTKVAKDSQPFDSEEWYNIRNPEHNQWMVNSVSPFGPISVFVYIATFFLLFRLGKKSTAVTVTVALFLSYVLLVIFPTFDNPSIAKTLPALLWIPLSLTVGLKELIHFARKHKTALVTIALVAIAATSLNAYLNISYLYSNYYAQGEVSKFEHSYDEAAEYIMNNTDLTKLRLAFHTDLWNGVTFTEFFLSPYVLNRTVIINETAAIQPGMFNSNEDTVILTTYKNDLEQIEKIGFEGTVETFRNPVGEEDLFLFHIGTDKTNMEKTDTISAKLFPARTGTICTNQAFFPHFTGEYEVLHQGYLYYELLDEPYMYTQSCGFYDTIQLYLVDPSNVRLEGNTLESKIPRTGKGKLTSDIPDTAFENIDSVNRKDEDISLTFRSTEELIGTITIEMDNASEPRDGEWVLSAQNKLATMAFGIPEALAPGTFYIEFSFSEPIHGELGMSVIDVNTRKMIPVPSVSDAKISTSGNRTYSTVFFVPDKGNAVLALVLANTSQLLDSKTEPSSVTIRSLSLLKLTTEDIVTTPLREESAHSITASPSTITSRSTVLPSVYRAEIEADDGDMLVFQSMYSPYNILINASEIGKRNIPERVNGYAQGFSFNGSYSGTVYLVNTASILAIVVGIVTIIFNGGIFKIIFAEPTRKSQASW